MTNADSTSAGEGDASARLTRLGALCGILAPVLFGVVTAVLGLLEPGYSHVEEVVSMLGATDAPYSVVQRSNFVVSGVMLVAFAGTLHRHLTDSRWSWLGPGLLALAGLGWAGAGVFPIAGGGPGPADWSALTSMLHEATAGVFFYGMVASIYLLSRRVSGDPRWQGYDRYARWASVTALGLILFYGATGSDGVAVLPDGLLQRLYLAWVGAWVVVLAVHLFRQS